MFGQRTPGRPFGPNYSMHARSQFLLSFRNGRLGNAYGASVSRDGGGMNAGTYLCIKGKTAVQPKLV
jgi:hypothetical protein